MVRQNRGKERPQVNVSVDRRTLLTLRVLAARDDRSVPELLRPVIEDYVLHQLEDEDLAVAVSALDRSE